jgi:hypothetical protein
MEQRLRPRASIDFHTAAMSRLANRQVSTRSGKFEASQCRPRGQSPRAAQWPKGTVAAALQVDCEKSRVE